MNSKNCSERKTAIDGLDQCPEAFEDSELDGVGDDRNEGTQGRRSLRLSRHQTQEEMKKEWDRKRENVTLEAVLIGVVTVRLAQSGVVINSREGVYPSNLIQNDHQALKSHQSFCSCSQSHLNRTGLPEGQRLEKTVVVAVNSSSNRRIFLGD